MDIVKIKLVLAYDGTQYAGWQFQLSGVGVQQKVEEALGSLFPTQPRIHSSSRTDAGVHALGMVGHVDFPKVEFRMTPDKLVLAMNAHLPPDIRVISARRCRGDFHAQFDAAGKQYRYWVWNHPAENPLLRHFAWHVPPSLDIEAMRTAARQLLGQHDFRSFAANRNYPLHFSIRTLTRCDVRRQGSLLTFTIQGNGFLYKMCRGIVGTLVQVGQGKIAPEEIQRILERKDRRVAGMNAPAHGLILWKVFYSTKGKGKKKDPEGYDARGAD